MSMMTSTILFEYPHSLSYHEVTTTRRLSITFVIFESKMEECAFPIMSDDTNSSSEYYSTEGIFAAASLTALFTSSSVTSRETMQEKSVMDPSGVGTLIALPSSFPLSAGMTFVTARAAPVVVGTILTAADLARRKSL